MKNKTYCAMILVSITNDYGPDEARCPNNVRKIPLISSRCILYHPVKIEGHPNIASGWFLPRKSLQNTLLICKFILDEEPFVKMREYCVKSTDWRIIFKV